jgi:hypothetical protein
MHLLIGSNLSGFQSYLEETWSVYQYKLSLEATDKENTYEKLLGYAKKFKLIRTKKQLLKRLEIMMQAVEVTKEMQQKALEEYNDLEKLKTTLNDFPDVIHFYKKIKPQYDLLQTLLKKSQSDTPIEQLNKEFRDSLWQWLKSRIIVLHNYHANGNEVISMMQRHTPIGMHNKIIGIQNIKGTGLDFAYRWVAWGVCYEICQEIQSNDAESIQEGINDLASFDGHGKLTIELTQKCINIAKNSVSTQSEYYQAQIKLIETTINEVKENLSSLSKETETTVKKDSFVSKIKEFFLEIIEKFLDAGDAVKRRKKADKIYKDLVNFHISHKKAAIELQKITKRQKGGWFINEWENR